MRVWISLFFSHNHYLLPVTVTGVDDGAIIGYLVLLLFGVWDTEEYLDTHSYSH